MIEGPASPNMEHGATGRRLSGVWILGTLVLLSISLHRWVSSSVPMGSARTPVDRVNLLYARQWVLLQQAGAVIAPGASYTVTAADADLEMLLFMLSYSALPDRVAYPTRYWGFSQEEGARARYVVAYDCVHGEGDRLVVRRFPEGCVLERPGRAP
jgi:hypothetical protein